jgi:hypothetical protein
MNIRLVLQRSRKPPIAPGQLGADGAKAAKFSYSNYLRQQLFRSDLNAQDRDGILKELRLRSDTSTTLNWILAAFILALIFTILASRGTGPGKGKQPTGSDAASQPARVETSDGPKSESAEFEETAGRYLRHIGISLVWAVGIFGGGFLIGFLFNLACAHGQLAAIDRDNGIAVATNPHTQGAAEAITEALKLDPSSRQRIEELMDPKAPDNDLAVFNGPPNAVQDALAPPAKPAPPSAAPLSGKKWS